MKTLRRLHQRSHRARQGGIVLITVLFMIVWMTLIVLGSLTMSTSSSTLAGNFNTSTLAQNAAQSAIETVISSASFLTDPAAVAATPASVDVNGDGVADFNVALSASCVAVRPVLQSELDTASTNDQPCIQGGSATNAGIVVASGTATGVSLCSATRWEITAIATNASSGARSEIHQGVAVRMPIDKAATSCT